MEAGSEWKAKIQRNESIEVGWKRDVGSGTRPVQTKLLYNISNVYSVLDKKRDEDWWGWIISEE